MPANKDLLLIISKTSGQQVDLLPEFKHILDKHTISFVAKRFKTPPEIHDYLKKEAGFYKEVAVYGGDGSMVAAMKALIDTPIKLIVLPGGTANTIANELSLPNDPLEIIKMYAEKRYVTEYFDVASINNEPLILDMHAGWWTEAIKSTPRDLKRKYGPIAYGMSAVKQLPSSEINQYELQLNNKLIKTSGFTLLVANRGYQGFLGVSLFPRTHRSGILQIAIIKSISPLRIFIWLVGRLFNKNLGGAVRTYRTREVIIQKSPKEFLVDDSAKALKLPTKIRGATNTVKVIVAPAAASRNILTRISISGTVTYIRFKERFRNLVSGQPSFAYSQITPRLYVGGTYRSNAYTQFKSWGVTGVVNMRSSVPRPPKKGFEILHLKTRDWTPPSIADFVKGVDFMNKKVAAGGSVYVHCRQGEGRGPSMAAAYLMSQGLSLEEALRVMKKARPMARPNKSQVKRLAEWQEYISKTK